ncbi:SDR family oxidoreductase [Terrarubrum flagellatum]|uniref:SDR family oxidoreductase n=1 Tax=Terrirubrum flagellatum TaxID=2895980 RepID=UPI003144DFED
MGQAVAITGASGHLGQATAAAFRAAGWTTVLVGRSLDSLGGPTAEAGVVKIAVDFANEEAMRSAFDEAAERLGGIDALCCIAGAFAMSEPVHEMSRATLDRMIDGNAGTMMAAVRAAAPGMIARGKGAIVTVGAVSAQRGGAEMGAYAAAKSMVMRLTESMAAELGPQGIRINCILPAIIDTPDNRAAMPKVDPGKWTSTEDIAHVVRFLCSDDSRAIHGAMIPVSAAQR